MLFWHALNNSNPMVQDILEQIKVRNCKVVAHSDKPIKLTVKQVAVVIDLNASGTLSKKEGSTTLIHAGAYGKLPDGTRITMNVMSDSAKKEKLNVDEQAMLAEFRAQQAKLGTAK